MKLRLNSKLIIKSAVLAALCVPAALHAAGPFGDKEIASCIRGVMDGGARQEPIFAAAFCVCLSKEMNKQITTDDMATPNGVLRKVNAVQKEATETCIKSAKADLGK